ncbi:hypothetical protein J2777_000993 [Paraburkholderia graminis]|nr:hypothetical protein [Paraburkholderia graminis]MDR6473413.1 hypothetical protein [Paraburkholderia graminis]
MQIDALHEQRPRAPLQRRQFVRRERAMLELPFIAKVRDEARLDVVFVREFEQLVARKRRFDVGNCLADQ